MKSYILRINLIFLIILGLCSCKTNKSTPDQEVNNLKSNIIEEAIHANFNASDSIQIIPNKEGNWIVYLSESPSNPTIPNNQITFFVYDKTNKNIIYKNKFDNANIKWFDNKQLILTKNLGVIEKSNTINQKTDNGIKTFIIDLKNKNIKEIKDQKEKPII